MANRKKSELQVLIKEIKDLELYGIVEQVSILERIINSTYPYVIVSFKIPNPKFKIGFID